MKTVINNNRNIVSVSLADHFAFGEKDGQLANPESLERRIKLWKNDLGAQTIHWRQVRSLISGHFFSDYNREQPLEKIKNNFHWDDFEILPKLAHENGMLANLYVTLFDEGWPLLSKEERKLSYHNKMHGQHVSWQSKFSYDHPEYNVVDRTGKKRQWGVLSLAYKEVRKYFVELYLNLLNDYNFDGLFICFRSQSKPADFADQFNFNEPIRKDFKNIYGKDIIKDDFSLKNWRNLLGKYITDFLKILRKELKQKNISLSVGLPIGDIIGPPMGNTTLEWSKWVQDELIDELIINQNSCRCPSMWHKLWPMHDGLGYIQQHDENRSILQLKKHLNETYFPIISKKSVKLCIARQWDKRSKKEESELLNESLVSGLVFSSFRFDNPASVSRNNWRL